MSKGSPIPADLDERTLAELDLLCAHLGGTREHLVTTGVLRFVSEEIGAITTSEFDGLPPYRSPDLDWEAIDKANASLEAFIKEGEDAIARGDWVTHEELMAELKDRYGKKQHTA